MSSLSLQKNVQEFVGLPPKSLEDDCVRYVVRGEFPVVLTDLLWVS